MRETEDADGEVPDDHIRMEPLVWTSAAMRAQVDLDDRDAVLDLLDDEPS